MITIPSFSIFKKEGSVTGGKNIKTKRIYILTARSLSTVPDSCKSIVLNSVNKPPKDVPCKREGPKAQKTYRFRWDAPDNAGTICAPRHDAPHTASRRAQARSARRLPNDGAAIRASVRARRRTLSRVLFGLRGALSRVRVGAG